MEKMIDFIFSKKFSIQKEINLSCFTYTHKSLFELKFDFMMNFFIDTL